MSSNSDGFDAALGEEDPWDRAHHLAEMLVALSYVTEGDYSARLSPAMSEDNPFSGLYNAVNEMIAVLERSAQASETYQRDLEAKIALIERQRDSIRELTTPVIEVKRGVLCVPIVGVLDSERTAEVTDTLLSAVVEKRARAAIIDVTGIEAMDSRTLSHFVRMARGIRIVGAECLISGTSPEIAWTMASIDADLGDITSCHSLRAALEQLD